MAQKRLLAQITDRCATLALPRKTTPSHARILAMLMLTRHPRVLVGFTNTIAKFLDGLIESAFALVAIFLLLSLAATSHISAQAASGNAPPATPGARAGKIRGLVFDSLLMEPVGGATVTLVSRAETVTSDDQGRFSFDNVSSGSQTLEFESAELDSLGLGTMGTTITIVDGETARVTVGTFSLRTLWQRRCKGARAPGADSGIVWGTIRDANSNKLLNGAVTTFSWFDMRAGGDQGLRLRDIRREVLTDDTGLFFACGIPTDVIITSAAIDTSTARGKSASGFVEYAVGSRRLQRFDFVTSPDMIAPVSASRATTQDSTASARARGRATLTGTVLNEKKRPVADATITVASADTSVTTSADGTFILGGLPAGTHAMQTRRIGFAPVNQTVSLRSDSITNVQVISASVNVVSVYNVRADATKGSDRAAFDLRRKLGFGTFIEAKDMTRRYDMASVLRGVSGLRVEQRNLQLLVTTNSDFGRQCVPSVFIDGLYASFDVISMMRPADFKAIEVYPRGSSAPMQYAVFSLGQCGLILFWTKDAHW